MNDIVVIYNEEPVLVSREVADYLEEELHTAVASGSWCGAERQRCGASGSPLM